MEQELYHYGVLGMKWGVRRYQNADGTLTAEGRKKARKEYREDNRKAFELGKQATTATKAYEIANARYNRLARRGASEEKMQIAGMTMAALKQFSEQLTATAEMNRQELIDKYGEEAVSEIKYDKNGSINEKIYSFWAKVGISAAMIAAAGPFVAPFLPSMLSKKSAGRGLYKQVRTNAEIQVAWEKEERKKQALKHHGIEGQKWGVRRGPPYPIEDRILRKGTRLNSVSTVANSEAYRNKKSWMYTYREDDEWDNKVYKGPFTAYKIKNGANFVYENRFETVEDLLMPTKKQRIDEMKNLPRKQLIKELKRARDLLIAHHLGTEQDQENYKKIDLDNLVTDKDWSIAYTIFGHMMENVAENKSTVAYAKIMSKKFGAMVDDNNVNRYNEAHDPIIIFNAKKFLKTVANYPVTDRIVKYDEVVKNYQDVEKELAKRGKHVLL